MTEMSPRGERVFARLQAAVDRLRGRAVGWLSAASFVLAYIWVLFPKFASSLYLLQLTLPILAVSLTKMIIDIRRDIGKVAEPVNFSAKECVHRLMESLRSTARWKHSRSKPITIDLIGVWLRYSHDWIEKDLVAFMREHPAVCVCLRVVFVDPDALAKFGGSPDQLKRSRERVNWVQDELSGLVQEFGSRLKVHVRTVHTLPQQHGILVERRDLFLGWVDWADGSDRDRIAPSQLTCAENGYQYFNKNDLRHGDAQLSRFRHWMAFYLYGRHNGSVLINTMDDDGPQPSGELDSRPSNATLPQPAE